MVSMLTEFIDKKISPNLKHPISLSPPTSCRRRALEAVLHEGPELGAAGVLHPVVAPAGAFKCRGFQGLRP